MDGFECINTNRIDASINSDIASQPVDRFNRIFLVEIDDFGALFTRRIESGLDSIHSEDPPGSEQLCTSDYELTDRATTEDRDSVSPCLMSFMRTSRKVRFFRHDTPAPHQPVLV